MKHTWPGRTFDYYIKLDALQYLIELFAYPTLSPVLYIVLTLYGPTEKKSFNASFESLCFKYQLSVESSTSSLAPFTSFFKACAPLQ